VVVLLVTNVTEMLYLVGHLSNAQRNSSICNSHRVKGKGKVKVKVNVKLKLKLSLCLTN
jgi:hypothetical protein